MNRRWFVQWGWVYRPVSPIGVALTLGALAFCVHVFFVVDARSHSVSDTLYGIFPYVVPCLLLLGWVASRTCPTGHPAGRHAGPTGSNDL